MKEYEKIEREVDRWTGESMRRLHRGLMRQKIKAGFGNTSVPREMPGCDGPVERGLSW